MRLPIVNRSGREAACRHLVARRIRDIPDLSRPIIMMLTSDNQRLDAARSRELGVTLSSLFAAAEASVPPLSRRADQPVWRDPATGRRAKASTTPAASDHQEDTP